MKAPIKPHRNLELLLALCIALFSVLSFNCKKDEDPAQPVDDMALVGTWEVKKLTFDIQGEVNVFTKSKLDSMGKIWTYKFENDYTLELTSNWGQPLQIIPGIWNTSGDTLNLALNYSGVMRQSISIYSIHGSILKLNWGLVSGTSSGGEWTKQ